MIAELFSISLLYLVLFCYEILAKRLKYFCSGEVYSIQHYVIKFVSDLRQINDFLSVLQFPPPIKLTATI